MTDTKFDDRFNQASQLDFEKGGAGYYEEGFGENEDQPQPFYKTKKFIIIVIVISLVVLALGIFVIWWFFIRTSGAVPVISTGGAAGDTSGKNQKGTLPSKGKEETKNIKKGGKQKDSKEGNTSENTDKPEQDPESGEKDSDQDTKEDEIPEPPPMLDEKKAKTQLDEAETKLKDFEAELKKARDEKKTKPSETKIDEKIKELEEKMTKEKEKIVEAKKAITFFEKKDESKVEKKGGKGKGDGSKGKDDGKGDGSKGKDDGKGDGSKGKDDGKGDGSKGKDDGKGDGDKGKDATADVALLEKELKEAKTLEFAKQKELEDISKKLEKTPDKALQEKVSEILAEIEKLNSSIKEYEKKLKDARKSSVKEETEEEKKKKAEEKKIKDAEEKKKAEEKKEKEEKEKKEKEKKDAEEEKKAFKNAQTNFRPILETFIKNRDERLKSKEKAIGKANIPKDLPAAKQVCYRLFNSAKSISYLTSEEQKSCFQDTDGKLLNIYGLLNKFINHFQTLVNDDGKIKDFFMMLVNSKKLQSKGLVGKGLTDDKNMDTILFPGFTKLPKEVKVILLKFIRAISQERSWADAVGTTPDTLPDISSDKTKLISISAPPEPEKLDDAKGKDSDDMKPVEMVKDGDLPPPPPM